MPILVTHHGSHDGDQSKGLVEAENARAPHTTHKVGHEGQPEHASYSHSHSQAGTAYDEHHTLYLITVNATVLPTRITSVRLFVLSLHGDQRADVSVSKEPTTNDVFTRWCCLTYHTRFDGLYAYWPAMFSLAIDALNVPATRSPTWFDPICGARQHTKPSVVRTPTQAPRAWYMNSDLVDDASEYLSGPRPEHERLHEGRTQRSR